MASSDIDLLRLENVSSRDHAADALAIATVFAATQQAPPEIYEPGFEQDGPILQIGFMLYSQFRYNAEQANTELPWVDVEHGYHVCAVGIQKCLFAYRRFCNSTGTEFENVTLLAGLLNPKTIQFFTKIANISAPENREYETFFNLWQYENSDYNEFSYEPEQGYFLPNSKLENEAEEEAACVRYDFIRHGIEEPELQSCPAKRFIPIVWRDMAQECSDSGLFTVGQ